MLVLPDPVIVPLFQVNVRPLVMLNVAASCDRKRSCVELKVLRTADRVVDHQCVRKLKKASTGERRTGVERKGVVEQECRGVPDIEITRADSAPVRFSVPSCTSTTPSFVSGALKSETPVSSICAGWRRHC